MPEPNGNERDARLERMERDHEEFRRDLRQLLTAQVLQKDAIDEVLKIAQENTRQLEIEAGERREKDAALDKRVNDLVSSIGDLIRRIPPENLR